MYRLIQITSSTWKVSGCKIHILYLVFKGGRTGIEYLECFDSRMKHGHQGEGGVVKKAQQQGYTQYVTELIML